MIPPRFMDWPLRAKIAVLVLAVSLVPLMTAAYLDIRSARRASLDAAAALLAARADHLVGMLDTFHHGYRQSVGRIARLPVIVAYCAATVAEARRLEPEARGSLAAWPASAPEVRGAALIDRAGIVRVATEPAMEGRNLADLPEVHQALAGQSVISEIHVAGPEVGETPTIAYLETVRGPDGALLAVGVIWVRAEALWAIARASNGLAGPNSFAVLFDEQGIRVGHTDSHEVLFHPGGTLAPAIIDSAVARRRFGARTRELLTDVRAFPQQFDRARQGAPDTTLFRGHASVKHVMNYGVARRLETVPWTLFYMIPEVSVAGPIAQMTRGKLAFAGFIILLALAIGAILAQGVLRPISALTKAAEALGRGELGARVRSRRRDEIGALSASFDAMAERIQAQNLELRETTERTAEARKAAMFEASLDAVVMMDHTGTITEINASAEHIFGYPRDEAIGAVLADLYLPPDLRARHREGLARYVATGEERILGQRLELVGMRKDGTEFPVELAIVRVASADPPVFVGYIRDVSERERLARERIEAQFALRQTEDQLRQAQRMEAVGNLAGGIAHDFNNLLSVILGYASRIGDALGPDHARRDDVEQIRYAARRAAELTRQLLAFGRRQVLLPRQVDLNDSVEATLKILARTIGEDVAVVFRRTPDLGTVYVDPGQVEQVLMNLVVNARDAMPHGGRITIETANVVVDDAYAASHPGAFAGPHVVLSVADTGIGMDAETQAHIFEPFFTTKEVGKGTGLGLAMVFGIVKQSSGHIWVYSEPGQGATFRIYFPQSEGSVTPAAPRTVTADRRGSETILLVEDDEALRNLSRLILEGSGYRVLVAPGPDEALAIAEDLERPIQMLLSDVVMPGMNGRQLAERVITLRPGIKILLVSGYSDDAILRRGGLGPAFAFLQKPMMPGELLARVRELLDA